MAGFGLAFSASPSWLDSSISRAAVYRNPKMGTQILLGIASFPLFVVM